MAKLRLLAAAIGVLAAGFALDRFIRERYDTRSLSEVQRMTVKHPNTPGEIGELIRIHKPPTSARDLEEDWSEEFDHYDTVHIDIED